MPSAKWYELRDLHRQLWQWLGDHPDKYKEDWPGWEDHPAAEEQHCFACYGYTCDTCPCHWGSRANYYCIRAWACAVRHTVYRKYMKAVSRRRLNLASLYATRIRDAWVLSDD